MLHFLVHLLQSNPISTSRQARQKKVNPAKAIPKIGLLIDVLWSNTINYEQHRVIDSFLLSISLPFLCILSERKKIGFVPIKNFLRNGGNWEINRLISSRWKNQLEPFFSLFIFRWHKLCDCHLQSTWVHQMEVQQVSGWLLRCLDGIINDSYWRMNSFCVFEVGFWRTQRLNVKSTQRFINLRKVALQVARYGKVMSKRLL